MYLTVFPKPYIQLKGLFQSIAAKGTTNRPKSKQGDFLIPFANIQL